MANEFTIGTSSNPAPFDPLRCATAPLSTVGNKNSHRPDLVIPVSPLTNWQTLTVNPKNADATPHDISTWSARNFLEVFNLGTSAMLRLRYPKANTVTTNPEIYVVGFDGEDQPSFLYDSNDDHQLVLAFNANDLKDGVYGYTKPVEVDMDGCRAVTVGIVVAAALTGDAAIQIKVK